MDLYRLYDEGGRLLYVGISYSAIVRQAGHRTDKGWWHEVARMTVQKLGDISRAEAERIEREAIVAEKPLHNKVHNRVLVPSTSGGPRRKTITKLEMAWFCRHCNQEIYGGELTHGASGLFAWWPGADRWQALHSRCADEIGMPIARAKEWRNISTLRSWERVTKWHGQLARKSWFDEVAYCDGVSCDALRHGLPLSFNHFLARRQNDQDAAPSAMGATGTKGQIAEGVRQAFIDAFSATADNQVPFMRSDILEAIREGVENAMAEHLANAQPEMEPQTEPLW